MANANEIAIALVGNFSGLDAAMEGAVSSVETGAKGIDNALQGIASAAIATMAETGQAFTGAAEKAAWSLGSIRENISQTGASIRLSTAAMSEFGEALGAVFVAEKLKRMVESGVELGAQLVHMSEETGLSVTQLEHLRFAAAETDVDFDRLTRVMSQFSLKLLELRSGTSSVMITTAIKDLGLDEAKLQTEGLFNAMSDVGAAIKRAKDAGTDMEKVLGDVSELLGARIGATMIPLLENFDALNQKAGDFRTLTTQEAQGLEGWNQTLKAIGFSYTEMKAHIGGAILGIDVDTVADKARHLREVIDTLPNSQRDVVMQAISAGDATKEHEKALESILATLPSVRIAYEDLNKAINTRPINQQTEGEKGAAGIANLSHGPSTATPEESPYKAQNKAQLQEEIADYKAHQDAIVAMAQDSARARMDAANSLFAFLKSKESEAAAFGLDLSKEEAGAMLAAASGQKADMEAVGRQIEEAVRANWAAIEADRKTAQADALADIKNQDSVEAASAALSIATAKAAQDAQLRAIKERMALGTQSASQQLAEQRAANAIALQEEIAAENARYAAKVKELNDEIDLYNKYPVINAGKINTALAQVETAYAEHQTKMAGIASKGADAVTAADTTAAKSTATEWKSTLDPISNGFDQMVTGVLRGNQTIKEAFDKMFQDIALSYIKSGVKEILTGGGPDALVSTGGLAGMLGGGGIGSLLNGSISGGGVNTGNQQQEAAIQSGQAAGPPAPSLWSQDMSMWTKMLGGTAGAVGGAAGAVGGATNAAANQKQEQAINNGSAAGPPASAAAPATAHSDPSAISTAANTAESVKALSTMLLHSAATSGTVKESLAQHVMQTGYQAIIMVATLITAIVTAATGFKILGTGAGGWDVPSFEGGGIVPAPGGGTWAILHSQEMVLPRTLADRVRNMTEPQQQTAPPAPSGGKGGDIHIHAMDSESFKDFAIREHGSIAGAMAHAQRHGHPAIHEMSKH